MTMDRGLLGLDQEIATWDTLMAAQSPAPEQQFYSTAEAFPAEPGMGGIGETLGGYEDIYAPEAADVYSYAEAAPDYSYQPEPVGPYSLVEDAQQPVYTPDFSYQPEALPEIQSPVYTPQLTPYAASSVENYQLDPAWAAFEEQQYQPESSQDAQNALAVANQLSAQGNEELAQMLYRAILGDEGEQSLGSKIIGGALKPIKPLSDAAEFMKDAATRNRSLANQVSTGGITGPVSGGNYYPADPNIVSVAGDIVLPQTPLDVALMAIPAALALPKQGLYGALAEGLAFGTGPLDALPDAARARAVLDVPQYAPEAARLTDVAGQTVVPRGLSAAAAETAPLGVRVAGAGDEVAQAATKQADEFAGNIRLAKFPEESRPAIAQWATEHADEAEAARRSVIPDAQVQQMARQLVEDTGGDWRKVAAQWEPGKAYNAEELLALNGTLASKADEVMAAARAAQIDDSAINQARLIKALTEQAEIQQIIHGAKAEAGRALRVNRQIVEMLDSGADAVTLRQALDATGQNPERIAAVAKMLTSGELNTAAKVNQFIRDVNKPSWWDMVTEFWYNSVLSGPWTHLRNMIGNSAASMTEPFRRAGSAALDAPLARLQGRAQERFWQEVPASIAGALQGIPDGIRGALATVKGDISPFAATRIELPKRAAIPGPLGSVVRIPSMALEMADNFFYGINYRMSLWADATRMARHEGLSGSALQDRIAQLIANPPIALTRQASGDAERLLFRGDPGDFAKLLTRMKNQHPAMNFIIPFIRTPANLFKFGVRNSPIGLLDVPMWKRVAAGNPQGVDELAQTLMGSMVAASFGAMIANGTIDITAGVPTNAAERDRFYREGKLPFSVKVPGVGWVQYNQIPGLDTTLASVAAVVQGIRNGQNVDDIASETISTIGQSLLDRSYMNGLSDFMDAVNDPARFAAGYAERQVSSFVPFSSAQRQVAQAIDPTIRDPENLLERVEANIPGLTGNVPPRLNAFGEEAQRGAPSPIQISAETQSMVDAELERVGAEVTFVGKSIGGQKLNREQQYIYQAVAGQVTYRVLEALFESESYQRLADAQKEDAIERAIKKSRDVTREKLSPVFFPEDEKVAK